tara:strand:+ start:246 stop:890 length:645 start_codon:yes stop_codon:yes gene_type:complete
MAEEISLVDDLTLGDPDLLKPYTLEEIDSFLANQSSSESDGLITAKELGISLKDLDTSVVNEEGDSFFNKLAIGTDQALGGLSEGVGLLLSQIGEEDSAKSWRKTAEEYRTSAAVRPQPTQSASITKELPEIGQKLSDGEIGEALSKIGGQMETLTATALPSLAPAAGGYALASTILSFIPATAGISLAVRLAGLLVPSYLSSSGEVYKKSKDL